VLSVVGESTLIEATVARLSPLIPPERLWVLTNSHLRAEIVRQLPQVPQEQILAEPEQRNTAPAIGLAAHILQSIDKNSVMGVFPSDHVILKPRRYLQFVRQAFRAAEQGHIAVLGIAPRRPDTGFGYIEFPSGAKPGSLEPIPVVKFREKPDQANRQAIRQSRPLLLERRHVFSGAPTCCWQHCGSICPRRLHFCPRCRALRIAGSSPN